MNYFFYLSHFGIVFADSGSDMTSTTQGWSTIRTSWVDLVSVYRTGADLHRKGQWEVISFKKSFICQPYRIGQWEVSTSISHSIIDFIRKVQ